MHQHQFEQTYQDQWTAFEKLLAVMEKKTPPKSGPPPQTDPAVAAFPMCYRQICNHYSLAKARHYSPALVDRLHNLALRGHRQLYKKKSRFVSAGLNFVLQGFPATLRRQALPFWMAFALFFGPAVILGIATHRNPILIYALISESNVAHMESMYDPQSDHIGRAPERDSETDFAMFGFYILNNISIGFRTFAGGIIFGIGSVFLLVFNGLHIGGIAGHLSHPPYAETFWQFVAGHGALELMAIVICGAAGLVLGLSLIRPGPYRRAHALRRQAKTALRLVMGAALMLVCAAFVEAFWSSMRMAPTVKYTVGAVNWLLVASYLLFAGRGRLES